MRRRASGADPRSRPRKCPSARSWGANDDPRFWRTLWRAALLRQNFEPLLAQVGFKVATSEGGAARVNHERRYGGPRERSDEHHVHERSPRSAQASLPQPGGRRRQDDEGPVPLRARRYRHPGRPALRRRQCRPRPRLLRRHRGGVDVRRLRERPRRRDRAPHRASQTPPVGAKGRPAEATARSLPPLLQRLRPREAQEQRVQAHPAPVARHVRRRGLAHPTVHRRRIRGGLRAVQEGTRARPRPRSVHRVPRGRGGGDRPDLRVSRIRGVHLAAHDGRRRERTAGEGNRPGGDEGHVQDAREGEGANRLRGCQAKDSRRRVEDPRSLVEDPGSLVEDPGRRDEDPRSLVEDPGGRVSSRGAVHVRARSRRRLARPRNLQNARHRRRRPPPPHRARHAPVLR